MARAGHSTTVAASTGSQAAGRLLPTGNPVNAPDQYESREREHSACILEYLSQHSNEFDLIHDKSGSFFRHAAECPVPVLATLHLPRSFYREEYFHNPAPTLFLNCVSPSQAGSFDGLPNFDGVVENGIAVDDFPFSTEREDYLLWLGRILRGEGSASRHRCGAQSPPAARSRWAGLSVQLSPEVFRSRDSSAPGRRFRCALYRHTGSSEQTEAS